MCYNLVCGGGLCLLLRVSYYVCALYATMRILYATMYALLRVSTHGYVVVCPGV